MVELIVVFAVLVLVVVTLLPGLTRRRIPAARITCVTHLKQVTLAFRMWANDNEGKFPFAVSATNEPLEFSGTQKFVESGEVWRHFATMRRELNTPKVLVCPSDSSRTRVADWTNFNSNVRLSYFVGFDADETKPMSILTGDRNLKVPIDPRTRLARVKGDVPVEWTSEIHKHVGNIGLGDGSVAQTTALTLQAFVTNALPAAGGVIRLGIP